MFLTGNACCVGVKAVSHNHASETALQAASRRCYRQAVSLLLLGEQSWVSADLN